MATKNFLGTLVQIHGNDLAILAGGKVYFYEPGTSTAKDTYSYSSLTTANANPVVLDAYGRAEIWLDGDYKVIVADSNDVTQYTADNINRATTTAADSFNPVENSSFEDDADSDGKPDNWDITLYTNGTQTLDTTSSVHSRTAIKFTSTGTGGGYCTTTNFMAVSAGEPRLVAFDLNSTVADLRVLVTVDWYTGAATPVFISSSTAYDDSTTNPTSFTRKYAMVTAPATAKFAKITMHGAHSSDVTAGSVWFDNVLFTKGIELDADFTLSGAITANGVLTLGEKIILKVGADIASAAALPVNVAGNFHDVTGTTTVTSLDACGVGTIKWLQFDGAVQLTHHATDLILPGGANYTTAAGDILGFYEYAAGDWRVFDYILASGKSIVDDGKVVQVVEASTTAYQSTTTTLPYDDTIPQNSEGVGILTVNITPKDAANILLIEGVAQMAHSTSTFIGAAIFKDSYANSLACSFDVNGSAANHCSPVFVGHNETAGGTSAISFTLRCGANNAGTTYINGSSGSRRGGGVLRSYIRVTEVKP